MRFISLFLLSIFLFSCGASVAVDYDRNTDFSKYTSYNFYPSIQSGLSPLDDARIVQVTDSLLQERGFVKSESPQFHINFFARESISNSRSTLGIGVGGGSGNVGVGVSGGIPIGGRIINQQLTMDFIDVEKNDLIWQAVVDGEMKERASPQQKEEYYFSVIQKILKKFPPNKK